MTYDLVIARGFRGEPRKLIAVRTEDGRVIVGSAENNATDESVDNFVSLPRSNVFEFRAEVFEDLRKQWEMMGQTDPDTWRSLSQWKGRALVDA